jgi:hypothetical protein
MIIDCTIPAGTPVSHLVCIGDMCVTGIYIVTLGPYGTLEIEALIELGEQEYTIRHECGEIQLDAPNSTIYISLHPSITKPWPYIKLRMDQNQTAGAIFKLVVERVR